MDVYPRRASGGAQREPVKRLVREEHPERSNRGEPEIAGRPHECPHPEKTANRPSDCPKRLDPRGQTYHCLQALSRRLSWAIACQRGTYTPPGVSVTFLGMVLAALAHFLVPGGEGAKRVAAFAVLGVFVAAGIYVTWIDSKENRLQDGGTPGEGDNLQH